LIITLNVLLGQTQLEEQRIFQDYMSTKNAL